MALQYLLAPTFQFVNTAGKPLSGGAYMEVYVHGTRTKYFCASDFNGTLHPFRIPLDSLGSNIVLASDTGSYDVYAYNRYGTLMMSRYNVKPGAGGGIGGTITSTDGSIDIHPTEDGVDLSVNGLDPSCLKVSADPRTTDGKFHFSTLVQEGDQAYVDNEGAIRLIKGWYHFTANVQLAWNAGARNETHQVTLYTTLSNSVIDFDISHVHTETIELSGDVSIAEDGSELVIGVSGMPTGLEASVIGMDVHAITGKDGHDKYYAGNGITISNENYISADFDEIQEKLVAGDGVTIEGNVISAPTLVQEQADWTETDTESRAYIKNKPDIDVFATKTEVATGLAGKQDTIPDLAQIRAGAASGSSAVQPSDLAAVATTGDYNSLNNRPNLQQYATKTEVNTGLAGKQDVISDLSAIRTGAQLGATAVQPADLDTYATDAELTAGLSTKQDTINDLSTIRSGAAAGATALQPSDVATVATTGDYGDLSNKPTIPTKTSDLTNDSGYITLSDVPAQVNADWNSSSGVSEILNKPDLSVYAETSDLATVATTGSYTDLSNKPTIPSGTQLVPAATAADADKVLTVDSLGIPGWAVVPSQSTGLFQAQYGVTTYSQVVAAIEANKIVYCRISTDWNDSRMAFLAYDAHIGANRNVEFQYYRSVSAHSASTQTDEVYIYKVDPTGWTTTVRNTGVKVTAGTHMSQSYSNNTLTLNCAWPDVDQTYDAASANAQSGVAVAGALATKQDTISDLTTIRSGAAEGATAVQPGDLATVATSGSYDDLVDKPTIPAAQVNSDWNSNSGVSQILNKPQLSTVATTGDYADLSNKPSIPAAQVNSDWNAVSGVSEILNKPVLATVATTGSYNDLSNTPSIPTATSDLTNDSGFITLADVPAQVNADWNSSSGASEILNKPTIPSGTQLVPAATSADADKVLTVDAQGTPAWASAQAPITAGNGIDITNNVVSVDTSVVATQTDLSGKEDAFDVGTGLEMDTSGATPTLQVEAPVDIVAGPGIVIDNPDGNTLRVSTDEDYEKELYVNTTVPYTDVNGVFTLSEPVTNFERIRVESWNREFQQYQATFEFTISGSTTNTVFVMSMDHSESTSNIQRLNMRFSYNSDGNLVDKGHILFFGNGSSSASGNQRGLGIHRVVGIHRIAGGN